MELELIWLYSITLGGGIVLCLSSSLLLAFESSSRDYSISYTLGLISMTLTSLMVLCLSPRIISLPFLDTLLF